MGKSSSMFLPTLVWTTLAALLLSFFLLQLSNSSHVSPKLNISDNSLASRVLLGIPNSRGMAEDDTDDANLDLYVVDQDDTVHQRQGNRSPSRKFYSAARNPNKANGRKEKTKQRQRDIVASFFNTTRPANYTFSPNTTRIYLVHVGKAGGSFLYKKLGISSAKKRSYINCQLKDNGKTFDECLGGPRGQGPTQLWRTTVGHRHLAGSRYSVSQQRFLKKNGTNLLLFTVRDPVARVVSAYNFHHRTMLVTGDNRGKKFYDCFNSIETLAQATASIKLWENLSPKCQRQGYGFLKGINLYPGKHMVADYKYYVIQVWKANKAVAVVRTEHMAQDMANLEAKLGGDPANLGEFQKEARYQSISRNTGLSPDGKHLVCCMIVDEMPFFEHIVMLSVNLEHDEKLAYVRQSRKNCGVNTIDDKNEDLEAFSWDDWYRQSCPNITM